MTTSNVLCVGYTNWDVVLHTAAIPDPDYSESISSDHMSSGGSAANTALSLSSLGSETSIAGSIGDDEYGDFVETALEDGGVTPFLNRSEIPTTLVYAVITDGADPRYLAKSEEVGEVSVDMVNDDAWNSIDHVHVTSFSKPMASEFARQAKQDGKTVSFNPSQGYSDEVFEEVVEAADVLFLNEREARFFRERHNFGEHASKKCITITHGSAGSTSYTPNGVFHHSGFSTTDVADTIGAGDAFVAGFVHSWLDDEDVEQALELANGCGAYAVGCVGAPDELDYNAINEIIENS